MGLGTKAQSVFQEEDWKWIEKVPAVDETSDGHEAEPSWCLIVLEEVEDIEDQSVGEAGLNNELSMLIGAQMTTMETATMT